MKVVFILGDGLLVLRVELRASAAKLERCQLCRENNAPGFRGKWSIGFDLYSTRCKTIATEAIDDDDTSGVLVNYYTRDLDDPIPLPSY